LFSTYRLLKKQNTQLKNRIHSLLKERLHGFTQEEIFGKKGRRGIPPGTPLQFQVNLLLSRLERDEAGVGLLKGKIPLLAAPFTAQIKILTSMKGVSVFIAAAVIADIIDAGRFRNSKAFTSYLRPAPRMPDSNTSTTNRGTNKMGRKLAATLLVQSLNHVMDASPKLSRWYERLCQHKKRGMVRTGLRRRVFAEMYQMLKKAEYHYGRDSAKHDAKITQYERFLEKAKKMM
jgi:transposase